MHTEYFRVFKVWQLSDVINVGLVIAILRDNIDLGGRKRIFFMIEDLLVVIFFEDGQQANTIPVITDSSSIVDMTSHVKHCVPRHIFFLKIQKHLQGLIGHTEVTIIELISDVEA